MNNRSPLPLELYKTNLQFLARIGKLTQESCLQWVGFRDHLVRDSVRESDAEIESLLDNDNWQNFPTLPAESFWRQFQQRIGDAQAAAQIALGVQTTFAAGLQEALSIWQRQATESLGRDFPINDVRRLFGDLLSPWQNLAWPVAFTDKATWRVKEGKTD